MKANHENVKYQDTNLTFCKVEKHFGKVMKIFVDYHCNLVL